MGLALPAPFVKTDQGLDSDGVQRNFEALSLNAAVSFPAGGVVPFAGATAPVGYLLCDGASVSTTGYAKLFAVIAYTYGGSGASFNLPDLQGRVPVGKGTNAAVNTLNQSDGLVVASRTPAHSHTVPKHKHGVSVSGSTGDFNSNHSHNNSSGGFFVGTIGGTANISTGGGGYGLHTTDGRLGNHSHTVTASGTAGSAADPSGDANLTSGTTSSPYLVINYIIKI